MARWFGILISFVVGLIVLMPPGVCSCWINPARETVHVHFGRAHAEAEHSHEYLSQLTLTTSGGVVMNLVVPAGVLVALLSQAKVFWNLPQAAFLCSEWKPRVMPPPPRAKSFVVLLI